MEPDQELALRQLADIADADASFVVGDAVEEGNRVRVDFSLATGAITRGPGIILRARESFRVLIGTDFPYEPPTVLACHLRWAGTPHVHWGRLLCLHAAPAVEWNPADGMFGLIDRLWKWLESAAVGELDPEAAPLHPPVTYDIDYDQPQIIMRANAPIAAGDIYAGAAVFDRPAELRGRADVVGFKSLADVGATGWPEHWGLTVVMDGGFDWEYPTTVAALLEVLTARGLTRELVTDLLELGARELPADRPLVVLLGTPMRRIEGQRLIHFVAWAIPAEQVRYLRYRYLREADDPELREGGEAAEWLFDYWARDAKIAWCRLREDRAEVTRPREEGSPLVAFTGKTVVVWGCGALGAPVAEAVARIGPAKLVLYDNGVVAPGLLVRQPFADADIGRFKASCLAERLRAALPGLDVEARVHNILHGPLASGDWSDGANILIDATASTAVLAKLERVRAGAPADCFVISAAFGHEATRGLVTVTPPEHPAGPHDLARKVKLRVRTKAWPSQAGYRGFADEFWPEKPRANVFQPEPGCSEPTFRGSQAEVGALALSMLLWACPQITRVGEDGSALLTALPTVEAQPEPRQVDLAFAPDVLVEEAISGYQVRLAASALAEIRAHIRRNDRALDPRYETGGLLFGERDDATRVIWISEVAGPPPDSEGSADEFICGVDGVEDIRREKRQRGLGSLAFVGTWHTHPGLHPVPSDRDVAGMSGIVLSSEPLIPRALLLIVGGGADEPELGAYLFDRADLRPPHVIRAHRVSTVPQPAPVPRRDVGLALSGGGFRALAFHLGCLRALHDRGVLERVFVVSGVSGGSLAAALYAYSDDDFEAFDCRVCELLRGGLQLRIARRAYGSPRALETLGTLVTSGVAAAGARAAAAGDSLLAHLPVHRQRHLISPPLRRFSSATEALVDVFETLFPRQTLASARRDAIDVVLNACELRSGSAFRFGSRESHCYRYGTVVGDPSVATAVAASAAYPLLLPALDREFTFRDRRGQESRRRVVLTDGGVFDNLGTSVLEPGRDSDLTVTYDPAYVIACDAGRGLLDDGYVPYGFVSRMRRSFESTFRKAQDGARNRLHLYAASGELAGFVFPYLGQRDQALPLVPADLPGRAEVIDYPTDFAAMSDDTIELLAGRAEKLTRLLVDFYCPEL